jgi:hypothetical protein
MNEGIKKMSYIYTMEYYSTIRQKKCMSFVGKWMEMDGDHYVK